MAEPRAVHGDRTRVDLTWIEGRTESWIRFGNPVDSRIITRHRRAPSFRPGAVFALVRWAANDYGTVLSRIDIARTVPCGGSFQTLPCVRPGAELLLSAQGWPLVERVLFHVDAIEALGITPATVDPDHWRHAAHWLSAGEAPRSYTVARHRAWLGRQELGL